MSNNIQTKVKRPSTLLLLLESRALLEIGAYLTALPLLKNISSFPKGDGHPVLVLPGFTASDVSTVPLRQFLVKLGYKAYPWKLGRNLADFDALEVQMHERVTWLRKKYKRKVSLVGWSLGGIYAREIAKSMPKHIRQVVTLGSPFKGVGQSNNINWIYNLISDRSVKDLDPELIARIKKSPPVPTTAIYSRSDGIVSWQHCMEKESPITENIEVLGSHCGLGVNPMVLMHLAERLAQKEGQWKPYKEKMK